MCTIGSSYHNISGHRAFSMFKQCDLVDATEFLHPWVWTSAETGIRYFPLKRKKADGSTPSWAGVNEYGVCFVAADSYLAENNQGARPQVEDAQRDTPAESVSVFDMYEDTIKRFKNAKDAAAYAVNFYKNTFKEADIFMVGDADSCYFIEAYGGNVCCMERNSGFFASTNHFRMLYGAVPYEKNHSTYLRLNRAEQILSVNPDFNGIGQTLCDRYYGNSVWSICRSTDIKVAEEDAYYTQASVIFHMEKNVSGGKPTVYVEYVINGNPSMEGKCVLCKPFDSESEKYVSHIGNYEDIKNL